MKIASAVVASMLLRWIGKSAIWLVIGNKNNNCRAEGKDGGFMESMNYGVFPVQDVFEIKGRGVVATGRVEEGIFQREDNVVIMRSGKHIAVSKIKGIEIFGYLPCAMKGDNVGLLLTDITKEDICIGDIIIREEQ